MLRWYTNKGGHSGRDNWIYVSVAVENIINWLDNNYRIDYNYLKICVSSSWKFKVEFTFNKESWYWQSIKVGWTLFWRKLNKIGVIYHISLTRIWIVATIDIAKLCLPTFPRQIALYSPGCRLSSSRFVTINSTSIKPSIKVRNLTYYIFGESLWCW